MDLPREGREYARDTVTGAPVDAAFEVRFDDGTWQPMERDGDTIRVLLAGPDATDNPTGTIVLSLGGHVAYVRCPDNPEIVERFWGRITVT